MGVGEALKTYGTMRTMLNVRSVSYDMKSQLYKRVVVQTVTYRAENRGMTIDERGSLMVWKWSFNGVCTV